MTRLHWDGIAGNYESEVFDVLSHDQEELILDQISKYGSRTGVASDLGCGIGRFLGHLSGNFKKVLAVDIAPKCIVRSKAANSHLSNVSYMVKDLGAAGAGLPKVDFALSVNSILTPSLLRRNRMFDAITRHLRGGAYFVLVVPSIESAFLTDYRLIEWNLRNGVKPSAAGRAGFGDYKKNNHRMHEGVIPKGDVPTKHYLKEELVAILEKRRLGVVEICKIEYSWKTEFESPPGWMKGPYPWDWLFVARKTK
jgi:SAM-dependent methyltransferase